MHWVEKIKKDEHKALTELYHLYRGDCVKWLHHQFDLREDEAVDVFQMTIITLYDSAILGKVKSEVHDVKAFLFGVAKNKAHELLRKKGKEVATDVHSVLFSILAEETPDLTTEAAINLSINALKELGEPCKSVLEMYYYKNCTMEEIAVKLEYKNPDTAKTQKYKCLKRLQMIYFSHLKNNEAIE